MGIYEPADTLVQRLTTGFNVELRVCGVSSERWGAVMENRVQTKILKKSAAWSCNFSRDG